MYTYINLMNIHMHKLQPMIFYHMDTCLLSIRTCFYKTLSQLIFCMWKYFSVFHQVMSAYSKISIKFNFHRCIVLRIRVTGQ